MADWHGSPAWNSVVSSIIDASNPTDAPRPSQTAASGAIATGYSTDPILALQPPWSHSLISQLIAQSCVFAMLVVLILHLCFTARYHFPLSKINFSLQMSAAFISFVSGLVTLSLILAATRSKSRQWPYMYDYLQIEVPADAWDDAQNAGWGIMQGAMTIAVHATHIQFLTLLFPSSLEQRLILGLLGPLAALAACFEFATDLINLATISDLCDSIRTTCNSTLTLLYSLGLVIWGTLVNRKRAWRTDGGTSAFGALALVLAVVGSAINFAEIHEDQIDWLPSIVWCILLWQSWAGFWWWVGAGMYAGEVEDRERREARKKRRELKRARRNRLPPLNETLAHRFGRRIGIASGVEPRAEPSIASGSTRRRRRPASDVHEAIELRPLGANGTLSRDISDTSGETDNSYFLRFIRRIPMMGRVVDAFAAAHERAARKKADDQIQQSVQTSASPWGASERRRQPSARPAAPNPVTPSAPPPAETPSLGDERGMGEEAWEDAAPPATGPEVQQQSTAGEGMPANSWHWRGPVRRHRLREVDTYD